MVASTPTPAITGVCRSRFQYKSWIFSAPGTISEYLMYTQTAGPGVRGSGSGASGQRHVQDRLPGNLHGDLVQFFRHVAIHGASEPSFAGRGGLKYEGPDFWVGAFGESNLNLETENGQTNPDGPARWSRHLIMDLVHIVIFGTEYSTCDTPPTNCLEAGQAGPARQIRARVSYQSFVISMQQISSRLAGGLSLMSQRNGACASHHVFLSSHWLVTMVLIPRAVNSMGSGSSVAFSANTREYRRTTAHLQTGPQTGVAGPCARKMAIWSSTLCNRFLKMLTLGSLPWKIFL